MKRAGKGKRNKVPDSPFHVSTFGLTGCFSELCILCVLCDHLLKTELVIHLVVCEQSSLVTAFQSLPARHDAF